MKNDSELKPVRLACRAMATRFEVVLYGENAVALRAAGEEALDEVQRLERLLSPCRPDSEIGRVNARAHLEPVRVSPPVFRFLEDCRRFCQETDGAFDITVAPLLRSWGLAQGSGRIPSAEALAAARACVGMHLVHLDPEESTVRFERRGMRLDLGAVGKGYAVERASQLLREAGIRSAFLHGGTSTIYALGKPPDQETWRVALEAPLQDKADSQPQGCIKLGFSGRGQLVPGADASHLRGQAVPAPSTKAMERGLLQPCSQPRAVLAAAPPTPAQSPADTDRPLAQPRPLAVVELQDESLSVSAVWGKSFVAAGKTYGHVMDPRTGAPAQAAILAAVTLPSATESDAFSTALMTLGPSGHALLRRLRPAARTFTAELGRGQIVCQGCGIVALLPPLPR